MNESCIDYSVQIDPYFDIVQDNIFTSKEIEEFAKYYLFAFQVQEPDINAELESAIIEGTSKIDNLIAEHIPNRKLFDEKVKRLYFEIKVCRVYSHWYWLIWTVMTSKAPFIVFNYIEFGRKRLDMFLKDLEEVLEEIALH